MKNFDSKQQKGSSLIEMVVALFVLAIGMLGVMSMQLKSMQFNQSAYYYSQAVYLAYDILEGIRANPSMASAYVIKLDDATPTASVDCESDSVSCTPQQLKDWNLNNWRTNVASTLASGRSSIANDGSFVTITVQFDDSRSAAEGTDGADLAEYVLVTEI